jgi:hypothetical protein
MSKKKKELYEVELSNLRCILSIEPELRTAEHCKTIIDFLQEGEYLKKAKGTDLSEFARYILIRSYNENELIFRQGDLGDEFYCILKGKVEGSYMDK